MSERYKIDMESTRVDITDPWGCVLTLYDGAHATTAGALRQQQADIEALKETLHDEINANTAFREAYGAMPDEDMPTFCARIISERDKSKADIAELRAKIAEYRDEFSSLCHTLSVGSEGRPDMTASDWRKRVDEGISFLTRPLLSRIEEANKELVKRSRMLDICTKNCDDWIEKWRAEQERAERAEAKLDACWRAPTEATVVQKDSYDFVSIGYNRWELPPIGTELIARPAKD